MMGAWAIKGDTDACVSILAGLREVSPDLIYIPETNDVLEQVKSCDVIIAVVGRIDSSKR